MGRLIMIISILTLILGLSIGGIFYAKNVKLEFEERVNTAEDYCDAENQEQLIRTAAEIQELWEKREGFLSFYVRHDEIEKMTMNLVALCGYAEKGSFESANVTLSQIRFMADHIYHRELPNLDNLF